VLQDRFLSYMQREFSFAHIGKARLGDPIHFHSYAMKPTASGLRLELIGRLSTDVEGIAVALGLQASANVELARIVGLLETRLSDQTLLKL
jgi:hypothetical protein